MSVLKVGQLQTTTGNVMNPVIQFQTFNFDSTTTFTSAYNVFNVTITPKASSSVFFITADLKCSHTASNSLYFKLGINDNFDLASAGRGYPSATGSIYMEGYGNSHSANAQIDQFMATYSYQHSGTSAFNLKIQGSPQGGTVYMNYAYSYDDSARGRPRSSLYVWEIMQ